MSGYFSSLRKQSGIAEVPAKSNIVSTNTSLQSIDGGQPDNGGIQPLEQEVFVNADSQDDSSASSAGDHVADTSGASRREVSSSPTTEGHVSTSKTEPPVTSALDVQESSRLITAQPSPEIKAGEIMEATSLSRSLDQALGDTIQEVSEEVSSITAQAPSVQPLSEDVGDKRSELVVESLAEERAVQQNTLSEQQESQSQQKSVSAKTRSEAMVDSMASARAWVAAPFEKIETVVQQEVEAVRAAEQEGGAMLGQLRDLQSASLSHPSQTQAEAPDGLQLSIGAINVTVESPESVSPVPVRKTGASSKNNPHAKSRLRRRYFRL